jgi:hypothetical protein
MTDKHKRQGYITALQYAIWRMHGSESGHVQTVYLLETFQGETDSVGWRRGGLTW